MLRSLARGSSLTAIASGLALALTVGVGLAGCGASSEASRRDDALSRSGVSAENYASLRRHYLELAPDDPAREELQGRLLDYLEARSEIVLRAGAYDAIVDTLREMTSLLAPRDFGADRALPRALQPLAEHIATHGARRGDEARVLAAELILASLDAEHRAAHEEEYARVAAWGREARSPAGDEPLSVVSTGMGLVSVWEEHARLTPSPEVLDRLSGLYLALRDALSGPNGATGFRPPRSLQDMRRLEMMVMIMQRAPLEAAAVFLARGDLEAALARLSPNSERARGADSSRLFRLVRDATEEGDRGANALAGLGEGFGEGRPDVALGVCRVGQRRYPRDARFAFCLARASVRMDALGDAAEYYQRALELDDDLDLDVVDEALDALRTQIAEGAFQRADIGEVRTAAAAAHAIVALRALRFPSAEAGPLDQPTLHLALARAELANGFTDRARVEYQAAIDEAAPRASATRAVLDARRELATLELRAGSIREARALIVAGLGRISQGRDGDEARARLTMALAFTYHVEGDEPRSQELLREALRHLDAASSEGASATGSLAREQAASRGILRAILLRRLGDREGSSAAALEAITLVPSTENAEELLRLLIVYAPDPELADLAFWRACVGARISREAKARLALLVEAVRALASAPPGEEASRALASEAARGGFVGRLAGLVRGDVDEESALAASETGAERCQVHFYAAIRALREGDAEAARRGFEASVETRMLGQLEYGLSAELLRRVARGGSLGGPSAQAAGSASAAATPEGS